MATERTENTEINTSVSDDCDLSKARVYGSLEVPQADGVDRLLALLCAVQSELSDLKIVCSNSVNHTMLLRNAARPEPSAGGNF